MPLFWRIFLLNAVVLVTATALLLGPVSVSTPVLLTEAAVLAGGLVAMLVANAALLRIGLAPLRERASNAGHVLAAQEAERQRIAQELHDEVGQTLTAVLLELKRVADHAPPEIGDELHQVQETTRASLDEIRRIARRLRPGVLDELGLTSAIKSLTGEFSSSVLAVRQRIGDDLPPLDREAELVLYRVAQESLTNTARHAGARHASLTLLRTADGVALSVRDDGRGVGEATEGAGIRGMRERALLIGASLAVGTRPGGGTEVRLTVPVQQRSK